MEDYNLDDDIYNGVLSLIGAIFRLAAQDYKYSESRRIEVIEFTESEWFLDICDSLEVSPKEVKKRIYGGKVKQRSEYR
jgi:hypothetical protein